MSNSCTLSAWDTAIGRELFAVVNDPTQGQAAGRTLTLAYRFGALTGFVDGLGRLVSDPVHFFAPDLDIPLPQAFYDQIPNAPSAPLVLTLTTYENGKTVGTPYEKTVNAYADPTQCAPVLTAFDIRDVNPVSLALTGEEYHLIQGLSTARCCVEAQPRHGATLTAIRLAGETCDRIDLPRVDRTELPVELIDSRGFVTRRTLPLSLIPYRRPTNLATVTGLTPEGQAVLTFRGHWFPGALCGKTTALDIAYRIDGGEWIPVTPETEGEAYHATVTLTGLPYTRSVQVETRVSDGLVEELLRLTARSVKPVFDWGATDFRVNVPANIGGVHMQATYIDGGKELTLTAKGNGRQAFLILGTCNWLGRITGILWTRGDRAEAVWDGNPEVSIAAQSRTPQPDGNTWVTVTLQLPVETWDDVAILSHKPIFIE